MQNITNKSFMSATQLYLKRAGCVALLFILFSCSSIPLIQQGTPPGEESAVPPRYSMIFIIHGDGDYLYHDSRGQSYRADEQALAGALRVAVQNPQAEVLVFHQRSRKHTLLFFPSRDGTVYYYRYGQLLAKESYRRKQGASRFDPEVMFYRRFHAEEHPQPVRMFFYFGHEIPEFGGAGYDASYPHQTFTVSDLAGGLKRITTRDSTKFDLIVLSTCFNGTPHTIAALAPFARTIVASPENLHLSYFDLQPFERLDVGLRDGDVAGFANKFAHRSFERLTGELQTAVTVSVYDVDRVQGYIQWVDSVYDQTLMILESQKSGVFEHCDCAEDSTTMLPGMSEGVEVFYRPPRFGRLKYKQNHSGWECWRFLKKPIFYGSFF